MSTTEPNPTITLQDVEHLLRTARGARSGVSVPEERIETAIEALDRATGPGLNPGRLVRLPVADGHALYVVRTVGSRSCHLLHVPIHDGYHHAAVSPSGACPTRVIRERVAGTDAWREAHAARKSEDDAFYGSLRLGQMIHFLSSSGPIRCEVTSGRFSHGNEVREGICLRPLAFVGVVKHQVDGRWVGDVWEHDIRRIDPTGQINYGYHASSIRAGELFRAALHDVYESGRANPRHGDPRALPVIPIEPPAPSDEEAQAQRLWAAAAEARLLLSPGGLPLADPRPRLVQAVDILARALAGPGRDPLPRG